MPPSVSKKEQPPRAAAIRGAFDESSLDAPTARQTAIATLGEENFKRAYDSELTTTYEYALSLAGQLLTT
jgi:hypothetical protein